MMKKLKLLVICMALFLMTVMLSVSAYADDSEGEGSTGTEVVEEGSCGDNSSFKMYQDGSLVISGTGEAYLSRIVPTSLKKIILEEGITSISAVPYIYSSQEPEVTIELPASLKTIGNSAFYGLNITQINLPPNLENIGDEAFKRCQYLKTIEIPDGVIQIGYNAFDECTSLQSVHIPDSVTGIGFGAFWNCKALTDVNLPKNMTFLDNGIFYNCENLETIDIPDSITEFGGNPFAGCIKLKEIVLPKGLTNLGTTTFKNCTSITHIEIPDKITNIKEYVFQGCTNLTSVTIPAGVQSIRDFAFDNCPKLKDVYFNGSKEQWDSITVGDNNSILSSANIRFATVTPEKPVSITKASISGITNKTYTGNPITQSITISYNGSTLKQGTDYKLYYENNINAGTATVLILGIGKYDGFAEKNFNILAAGNSGTALNPAAKVNAIPVTVQGSALSKVTAGKKKATLKWKKVSGTTGYEIQYGTKKNFKKAKTKTIKKAKAVKTTIKKLKAGKKYYFRIRTYKTVDGKKYYSAWSKAKKVKIK